MTETATGAEFISEAHVRHIMRYVQARDWLKPGLNLADAACGTGYGSQILAKNHETVTGLDFSDDAINEANKTSVFNCRFVKCDLLKTDYVNCNAIVCIETLEHFTRGDGQKLLANFWKWIPGTGPLIVSTPYCTQSGPSPITKQHLWEYSLTDFEQALAQAGFAVEMIKTERHEGQAGRLGYAMAKAIKR